MALNEIFLQWNDYENYMINNLKALFRDEGYADVTLVTEGECSKAHKVVLSACSSLFKNIFKQNPCDHPIIVLHDITSYTLRLLLSFIYNGELCVSEEYLPILLNAADALKINGLSVDSGKGYNYSVKSQLPLNNTFKPNWEESAPDLCHDVKIEIEPDILTTESVLADENNRSNHEEVALKLEPDINERKIKFRKKILKAKRSKTILNDNNFILNTEKNKTFNSKNDHNIFIENKKILKSDRKRNFHKDVNGMKSIEFCSKKIMSKETKIFQSHTDLEIVTIDKCSITECIPEVQPRKKTESFVLTEKSNEFPDMNVCSEESVTVPNGEVYSRPTFPCPFCSRVYHSWGYRRRHVKSRHTTNKLSCKTCGLLSNSQASWYEHAIQVHGIPKAVARDGLIVMVEAHAVLASIPPSPASLNHHLQLDSCELGSEEV